MSELRKLFLVLTAALVVATASAASAGAAASSPTGSSTGTATVHARSHGTQPNITVGCYFNAVNPYQIVSGGAWYSEGNITSCTTPPPDTCNLEVQLQELVNNEFGGQSWQAITDKDANVSCSAGSKVITPGYRCVSIAFDHEFRTWSQLIVAYGTATGVNTVTSGTETIPCE